MQVGKQVLLTSVFVLISAYGSNAAESLRARVLFDDVIPPASPAVVKLTCGGRAVAEAAADEHGRFSFSIPEDVANRAGCRLSASAAGYEPASTPLSTLPRNPDIGALVLQRAGRWQGYALSVTSLAPAPQAREHFASAVRAMREGSLNRAEGEFGEAARTDPSFAEAWYQLARMRLTREEPDGAREALRKAIAADPWYATPYRPLLLLELGAENWKAAVEVCTALLAINPYLADVQYHRGIANLNLGRIEEAARDAAAIAGGPEGSSFALLHHLDGLIRERQGKPAEARESYRRYLAESPGGPAAAEVTSRLASLEQPR